MSNIFVNSYKLVLKNSYYQNNIPFETLIYQSQLRYLKAVCFITLYIRLRLKIIYATYNILI